MVVVVVMMMMLMMKKKKTKYVTKFTNIFISFQTKIMSLKGKCLFFFVFGAEWMKTYSLFSP